jgi:hypothetical protein
MRSRNAPHPRFRPSVTDKRQSRVGLLMVLIALVAADAPGEESRRAALSPAAMVGPNSRRTRLAGRCRTLPSIHGQPRAIEISYYTICESDRQNVVAVTRRPAGTRAGTQGAGKELTTPSPPASSAVWRCSAPDHRAHPTRSPSPPRCQSSGGCRALAPARGPAPRSWWAAGGPAQRP